MPVNQLILLVSGKDGLFGVDDDDEVTAVSVIFKCGFVLPTQKLCDLSSEAAYWDACSIHNVPLVIKRVSFVRKCSVHLFFPIFI